jgi:GNAT superfamily N-acetyltransferase
MHLNISNPKTEDREALKAHFIKTITDTFEKENIEDAEEMIQVEVNEQIETLERFFHTNTKQEYYLIARYQQQIVGTIALGKPNQLIIEHLKIKADKIPEIKSVYVAPNYQKKGVGSSLFQAIQKELSDLAISEYCLDCGYGNAQAYWIKKLGKPQIILIDHWSPGNHHMIWRIKRDETNKSK